MINKVKCNHSQQREIVEKPGNIKTKSQTSKAKIYVQLKFYSHRVKNAHELHFRNRKHVP